MKRLPRLTSEHRGGFTLLEVLIVVTVIGIVLAMALPGLAQARISANETSAIGTVKSVRDSNLQYRVRFGSYAGSLDNLRDTGYLAGTILDPTKAGYSFSYQPVGAGFEFTADPSDPGASGHRYFFVDQTGTIRFALGGAATGADDPL